MKPLKFSICTFLVFLFSCEYYPLERKAAVTTDQLVEITVREAKVRGTLIDTGEGIADHGHCWSTSENPRITDNYSSLGRMEHTGQFTTTMNNLIPETTYYVRAYVKEQSNVVYGKELVFSTDPITLPLIETKRTEKIETTQATVLGNIHSIGEGVDEISDYGFCWALDSLPTIDDEKIGLGNIDSAGEFQTEIKELAEFTHYYVRAYAINEAGIAYGNVLHFRTNSELPVLKTDSVNLYTLNPVYFPGTIIHAGDDSEGVSAYGHCWALHTNPTIKDFHNDLGKLTEPASFASDVYDLDSNTLYYYRAYAINAKGINYGEVYTYQTFGMDMVYVEGDSFTMGSNEGFIDEKPVHQVELDDFLIGSLEVTNHQFVIFLNDVGAGQNGFLGTTQLIYLSKDIFYYDGFFRINPNSLDFPVVNVSWYGAMEFCKWMGARLPSEAEWEYAAGSGSHHSTTPYSGSDIADEAGWYKENSNNNTHKSGTKTANNLDIYDMSGNVREWCNDWYSDIYYNSSPSNNPEGPLTGSSKVLRGGGYKSSASHLVITNRDYANPLLGREDIGFRVTRIVVPE